MEGSDPEAPFRGSDARGCMPIPPPLASPPMDRQNPLARVSRGSVPAVPGHWSSFHPVQEREQCMRQEEEASRRESVRRRSMASISVPRTTDGRAGRKEAARMVAGSVALRVRGTWKRRFLSSGRSPLEVVYHSSSTSISRGRLGPYLWLASGGSVQIHDHECRVVEQRGSSLTE